MKKIVLSFILILSLSVPVYANNTVNQDKEEAIAALYELMHTINEYYSGDEVSIDELYQNAANGMTQSLDEYSVFFTREEFDAFINDTSGNILGIGIQFSSMLDGGMVIDKVIEDSPAKKAGLLAGDIIVSINQAKIKKFDTSYVKELISTSEDPNVYITVKRAGKSINFQMVKAEVHTKTVELKEIPERTDIGLIVISRVGDRTASELKMIIEGLTQKQIKNVIIDFRGNPGGYADTALEICRMLVPAGPIFSTQDSKGNKIHYNSTLAKVPFENMAVLVDGNTASASELITAAMQDAGVATVIGQRTFGKGIIQTMFNLDSGDVLKLTNKEYLSRNNNKIHNIGITPDIEVDIPEGLVSVITLHNDSTGEQVADLKKILNYMGYNIGTIDDRYDSATKEAVTEIQKQAGLVANGQLDVETQYAVNIMLNYYIREKDEALETAIDFLTNS